MVLLSAGCSGVPSGQDEAVTAVDSAGVRIVTNDLARLDRRCTLAAEPRLTIGDRIGDPTHELYRVFGGSVLDDGRVALVDQGSQQLRFYSQTGDLLRTSGREGEGPGEFLNAFLLWRLPGDTLWVGDARPWEFEVFSPDGEWVRSVRSQPGYGNPPRGFGVLSDGRAILASDDIRQRSPGFQMTYFHLLFHDASGMLVDTVAVVPNIRFGQTIQEPGFPWIFPWFDSSAEMVAHGEYFLLGHGSAAEVRWHRVGEGLELERIVRWTGLDLAITPADMETAREEIVAQYADVEPSLRRRFTEPLLHEDRPVAEALPAFVSVLPGRDESMWIRLYRRPGAGHDEWVRFDRDGAFVCRLQVPERIEVYEFGADYLLATEEGDLEVEMVTLYDTSLEG